MKLSHLSAASAAIALLGGAAFAQTPAPPADHSQHHMPSTTTGVEASTTTPMPETQAPDGGSSTETDTPLAISTTVATSNVSVTLTTLTNGPVPDTAENRAKYGAPISNAGKRTPARGN